MYEPKLILLLAEDNRQAFDCVYDIYVRRLLSYSRRYIRNEYEAEDAVQEVFVSLWNNRKKLRGTKSVGPYLFTALRNRILDFYKARLNTPLFEDYMNSQKEYTDEEPQKNIEYEEFKSQILTIINELPPTQGKVVMMSKLYGMSNGDIAEALHLSANTIKNALSAGLKTLRGRLTGIDGVTLVILLFLLSRLTNV